MPPRWILIAELGLVLVESATFLVVGYLLCRRHPLARYAAVAAGAACLGYRILSSTFPHRFYITSPYLVLNGLITPAGFLLLAGALTMTMKKSRQRILIGVFSVVLTYYVFCDAAYLAVAGTRIASLTGNWEEGVMRQSSPFTCGPAAAATLLRAWDIRATEGGLAYNARTSFRGTELPLLADAIRALGRERHLKVAVFSTTFDDLLRMNRPAILLVERGRRRHAITLLRIAAGHLYVGDPSAGLLIFTSGDFDAEYRWNGRAIVAWRDPAVPLSASDPSPPTLDY